MALFSDMMAEADEKDREIYRLRRLLMKIHIHAEDGMGGSCEYAEDRLFQIGKLTRKYCEKPKPSNNE